jgi:hypothetical protein
MKAAAVISCCIALITTLAASSFARANDYDMIEAAILFNRMSTLSGAALLTQLDTGVAPTSVGELLPNLKGMESAIEPVTRIGATAYVVEGTKISVFLPSGRGKECTEINKHIRLHQERIEGNCAEAVNGYWIVVRAKGYTN